MCVHIYTWLCFSFTSYFICYGHFENSVFQALFSAFKTRKQNSKKKITFFLVDVWKVRPEFESRRDRCIHFRTNTLGNGVDTSLPSTLGLKQSRLDPLAVIGNQYIRATEFETIYIPAFLRQFSLDH